MGRSACTEFDFQSGSDALPRRYEPDMATNRWKKLSLSATNAASTAEQFERTNAASGSSNFGWVCALEDDLPVEVQPQF